MPAAWVLPNPAASFARLLAHTSPVEGAASPAQGYQYSWCVDPLDGTKEFLKRNGQFTVNIALLKGSHPVLGVVAVPVDVSTASDGTCGPADETFFLPGLPKPAQVNRLACRVLSIGLLRGRAHTCSGLGSSLRHCGAPMWT
jgi:hypothetical protein